MNSFCLARRCESVDSAEGFSVLVLPAGELITSQAEDGSMVVLGFLLIDAGVSGAECPPS